MRVSIGNSADSPPMSLGRMIRSCGSSGSSGLPLQISQSRINQVHFVPEGRMGRGFAAVFVVTLGIIAASAQSSHSGVQSSPSAGGFAPSTVVNQYCISCHSKELKTAGVVLEGLDFSTIGSSAPVLERVLRKVRTGEMPPAGMPRPDAALEG